MDATLFAGLVAIHRRDFLTVGLRQNRSFDGLSVCLVNARFGSSRRGTSAIQVRIAHSSF